MLSEEFLRTLFICNCIVVVVYICVELIRDLLRRLLESGRRKRRRECKFCGSFEVYYMGANAKYVKPFDSYCCGSCGKTMLVPWGKEDTR